MPKPPDRERMRGLRRQQVQDSGPDVRGRRCGEGGRPRVINHKDRIQLYRCRAACKDADPRSVRAQGVRGHFARTMTRSPRRWAWPAQPSRSPASTSRTSTSRCRSARGCRRSPWSACPTRRSPNRASGWQRFGRDGARPAAQAHHGQPRAGRPRQGGQPFRPADRARRCWSAWARAGDAIQGYMALGELALDGAILPVARRAARGGRRGGARARPDLPRAVRRRGGLARQDIEILAPASLLALINHFDGPQVLARRRRACVEQPRRLSRAHRHQGPGDRQARARDRRRRRPQPAADRPAGLGQVDAGGAPSRAAAAAGRGPDPRR